MWYFILFLIYVAVGFGQVRSITWKTWAAWCLLLCLRTVAFDGPVMANACWMSINKDMLCCKMSVPLGWQTALCSSYLSYSKSCRLYLLWPNWCAVESTRRQSVYELKGRILFLIQLDRHYIKVLGYLSACVMCPTQTYHSSHIWSVCIWSPDLKGRPTGQPPALAPVHSSQGPELEQVNI